MRMIAEPQDVTMRRYDVACDGAPVGELSFPTFGPSTVTPIAGQRYRIRRAGVLRDTFTLVADGAPIAHATQRDPLRRQFTVEAGERQLSLRAESLVRSGYLLLEGDRVVGALRPTGRLRRGIEADLPDELPLEVGVFLLWVVLLLWRRSRVIRAGPSY